MRFVVRSLPLRVAIPVMVLAAFGLLSLFTFAHQYMQLQHLVDESAERAVRTQMARLQRLVATALDNADTSAVEREVMSYGVQREISAVAVLDESGQVMFATRLAWKGMFGAVVLPGFEEAVFDRVAATGQPVIRTHPDAGTLHAYFPLPLPASGEARGLRRGGLYLERHLGDEYAAMREAAMSNVGYVGIGGLFIVSALILLLHRFVALPLRRLAQMAHRLPEGRTTPELDLRGRGEIVDLARTFNEVGTVVRRSLEDMRQRHEMFRALFDGFDDAVYLMEFPEPGVAPTFIDVNEAACRRLGYTYEELLNMTPLDLDTPEHAGHVPARIQAVRERGYALFESRHRTASGRAIPVEVSARSFELRGKSFLVTIVRDLSESKRAEFELRASESRYKEAERLAHLGSWQLDLDTDRLDWSDEVYRIFGIDPQHFEASYRAFIDTVHPDDRQLVSETYERSVRNREPYSVEHRICLPDGRIKYVIERGQTHYDDHGVPLRSVGTVQDVTERVIAMRELSRLGRTLRAVSAANAAVARATDEHALLQQVCDIIVEEAGFRMAWIGRAEQDAGRSITPLVHAGVDDGFLSAGRFSWADDDHGRGVAGTSVRERRSVIVREIDNDPRLATWREAALERGYAAAIGLPLVVEEAVEGTLVVYARDADAFTEDEQQLLTGLADTLAFGMQSLRAQAARTAGAEELQRLNAELEARVEARTEALRQINRELEAFTYSVSHDLRAPLRSIDGFSKVLVDRYAGQLDEQARHYLDRVRRASQHMGQLIDDLLGLSRINRFELSRRRVDLSVMASAILAELREREPQRSVEVAIAPGIEAWCDLRMARIVLENLLGNAWKYTGRRERARIEFSQVETVVGRLLVVRDNGAGFDMRYADRIFTPFQRLHRQDEFEGTGIGLATVQRVIQRHGGNIWAESVLDEGTSMYFHFGHAAVERVMLSVDEEET